MNKQIECEEKESVKVKFTMSGNPEFVFKLLNKSYPFSETKKAYYRKCNLYYINLLLNGGKGDETLNATGNDNFELINNLLEKRYLSCIVERDVDQNGDLKNSFELFIRADLAEDILKMESFKVVAEHVAGYGEWLFKEPVVLDCILKLIDRRILSEPDEFVTARAMVDDYLFGFCEIHDLSKYTW